MSSFVLPFEVGPNAMGWSRRTSSPASMSRVATRHRPRSSGHVCTRYEGSDDVVVILNSYKSKNSFHALLVVSYLLVAWNQPEPQGSVLYPNNEHKCRGLRKPGTWVGAACVSPYMPPHCHGEEGAMSQVNLASSASHSRSEERKARERGGLNSSIIPFTPIQESMTDLRPTSTRECASYRIPPPSADLQTTKVY